MILLKVYHSLLQQQMSGNSSNNYKKKLNINSQTFLGLCTNSFTDVANNSIALDLLSNRKISEATNCDNLSSLKDIWNGT